MPSVKHITDTFSVAPQIQLSQVKKLAERGYKSIVVNRPDNEDAGQPSFAEIKAAAEKVGLQAVHIPVIPGQSFENEAREYKAALADLPHPILGYCRSGARAAAIWKMATES